MKRFIIVDDEVLVRVGLRSLLDWQEEGYELVGEASNGDEAFALVLEKKPDLVLTDLVMPLSDGFSLIDRVRAAELPVGLVVLSCHNDFDKVREAMRRGADDYIFKLTLDGEELLETFGRLAAKRRYPPSSDARPAPPEPEAGAELRYPEDRPYRVLSVLLAGLEASSDILQELPKRDASFLSLSLRGNRAAAVLANGGRKSLEEAFRWMRDYADRYLGCGVLGAVSSLGTRAAEGPGLEAEAEDLLSRRCYGPGRTLAFPEDAAGAGAEPALDQAAYAASCAELSRAVELADPPRLAAALEALRTALRIPLQEDRLRSLLEDALVPFRLRSCALGLDPDGIPGAEPLSSLVRRSLSVDAALDAAAAYGEAFMARLEARRGLRREIAEVRRRVLADLSAPYTVEAGAAVAGMSPSHFAHVFKDETGSSFIDFVNACRLDRARELLRGTDLLVREVADRVGFDNPNYFCTLFKRRFGSTPVEERNRRIL